MGKTITRIKLVFLAVFFVSAAAVWGYQLLYGWPRDKCEAGGGWFDPRSRECGRVIYIPDITGRYIDKDGQERRVRMPKPEAQRAEP